MDGRELPGFYFDPDKKKYFKIMPSHKAPPGAPYTIDNVKKLREKEKAERQEQIRSRKRKRETVVIRHATSHLSKAYLERETGYSRKTHLMKSVWPNACVSQWEPRMLVPRQQIRLFDVDPATKTLYTNIGEHSIQRTYDDANPIEKSYDTHIMGHTVTIQEEPPSGYLRHIPQAIARMTSPVSSLHFLPRTSALCVTTYGSDRPPVVFLTDPERDGPYVGEQFTPKNCPTIWCSSPKPTCFGPTFSSDQNTIPANDTDYIAVGASTNLQLYTRSPTGPWDCQSLYCSPDVSLSEVHALEWLDQNTICFGQRNGTIKVYDLRSGGWTKVLYHPVPICRMRRADDFTRLVVSGLSNTMMLYDMRHAPTRKVKGPSNTAKRRHGFMFPASAYVRRFKFHNKDTHSLGLDVHARMGLIAGADEDGNVKIWNMDSGEQLRMFESPTNRDGIHRAEDTIRCVKFVDDEEDGLSLWASAKGGVTRLGWK